MKFGDYSGAKDHDFKVENVCPSFKQKNVLAESSTRQLGDNKLTMVKRKLMDNICAQDDGSKRDIKGATLDKYMTMDNGVRRPLKS